MAVQSVEALLDPATDADIRSHWELLRGSGLPSQARHTGPTNAPHLTLTVADTVPAATEDRLADSAVALPVALRWGGLLVFPGRRGAVLAWAVVADRALLDLQEAYAHLVGDGVLPTGQVGRWSPHVTLAHGLSPEHLGRAVELLTPVARASRPEASVVAVRRWDGVARRAWTVAVPVVPDPSATSA